MINFPVLAARRLANAAAVAGAGAMIAACGHGSPSVTVTKTITQTVAAGGGSASTTPSSPAPTTPAGAPGCLASGLQAQLGPGQGTAGTSYQVVQLINTSTSTCTLYGFPGVSFVTGIGGTQIGAPATRSPGKAKLLVTLHPGDKANLLLAVHDAGAIPPGQCDMKSVGWLRIYPPGDYGALYVQYKTQACSKASKSIMEVGPVRAGAGSAG